MKAEQIREIMTQARWQDLGKQLSPSMLSFSRNYERCNVYLTTGTITIQDTRKRFDKGVIYKNADASTLSQVIR